MKLIWEKINKRHLNSLIKPAIDTFPALTYHYKVNVDCTVRWLWNNDTMSVFTMQFPSASMHEISWENEA